ncbi:Flagellum-associated coiled-coil domain-containing protein 1 [Apodemus speciosus]|uniref:Flagellum-associated coiled-coil domain-containing protein 1 n=1 Tax=Apodemus speciosus TaxID=105296 RepID=A0ABQ0EDP2_APOSI
MGKSKPIFPSPISKERNYFLSQPAKSVSPRWTKSSQEGQRRAAKHLLVSLCSPGCPGPHSVDQVGLELRNPPASASQVLGLKTEVIEVSPGYKLIRNREQISVTLGDEMFNKKKHLESSDILSKVKISRTDIISDLEEQISELTAIIEQMNRDHQSAQKMLSNEMNLRCADMKQKFETESSWLVQKQWELKQTHKEELEKLENSYKEALKAEKVAAQEKLDEMGKEYKYLKNMFHMYQDSIYDEMEDKWSRRKAEWEKDEKMEREKILLQQKHRITKKFEVESEEEKRKMNESFNVIFDNFTREKEVMN